MYNLPTFTDNWFTWLDSRTSHLLSVNWTTICLYNQSNHLSVFQIKSFFTYRSPIGEQPGWLASCTFLTYKDAILNLTIYKLSNFADPAVLFSSFLCPLTHFFPHTIKPNHTLGYMLTSNIPYEMPTMFWQARIQVQWLNTCIFSQPIMDLLRVN